MADKKIQELTKETALTDSHLLITQDGAADESETKATELSLLKDYICLFMNTYESELTVDGWSDTVPYTQTVAVTAYKGNGNPHAELQVSDDIETGIAQKKQWDYITKIKDTKTSKNDLITHNITFMCYENKPTVQLNFSVMFY